MNQITLNITDDQTKRILKILGEDKLICKQGNCDKEAFNKTHCMLHIVSVLGEKKPGTIVCKHCLNREGGCVKCHDKRFRKVKEECEHDYDVCECCGKFLKCSKCPSMENFMSLPTFRKNMIRRNQEKKEECIYCKVGKKELGRDSCRKHMTEEEHKEWDEKIEKLNQ